MPRSVPARSVASTKASSISSFTSVKRAASIVASGANTMSAVRKPESGVSIFIAACIAREVSPILWPTTASPRPILRLSQAFWTA